MTPDEAEALAARTLAAMGNVRKRLDSPTCAADRERVASDLDGLRECHGSAGRWVLPSHTDHARRYADGLRRTANLYGVTP